MEVISRKEAKARGLKRYFTGKPCKHGHVSERYTGSGACVECNATPERKAYNARNARNARNATPERKAYKAAYMASYNATPERKVLNTARNTARNATPERKTYNIRKARERRDISEQASMPSWPLHIRRWDLMVQHVANRDQAEMDSASLGEYTLYDVGHYVPLKGALHTGLNVHYNCFVQEHVENLKLNNKFYQNWEEYTWDNPVWSDYLESIGDKKGLEELEKFRRALAKKIRLDRQVLSVIHNLHKKRTKRARFARLLDSMPPIIRDDLKITGSVARLLQLIKDQTQPLVFAMAA